ncbi:MAG: histidine phosphatase family protein [Paracoccaceae bacterium]
MIRLALLRHGHTSWNRAGRIQGCSDIPLDDEARAGLAQLQLPQPWDKADLWASPLMRAADTARLVADRDPHTSNALIEMNWGDWEGQHGAELLAQPGSGYKHIEDWGWHFRPPGGESPADLWARLASWVGSLTNDTVAVCHIGIMRILLARAYGWNFDCEAPFRIKRNRLFVIEVDGDTLTALPEPIRLIPRDAAP